MKAAHAARLVRATSVPGGGLVGFVNVAWDGGRSFLPARYQGRSGPAISWPSPPSAGPATPATRSRGSGRSTSASPGPRRTAVPGRSFLRVAFHPATTAAHAGPGTISPYLPALLQISPAGDDEGYLSFGLRLTGRGGYRVSTLTHPSRVVIEFPHLTLPTFPGIWDITSWRQFWQSQTAFENGHQPWLASPALVVRAWASGFSSQPTIQQTGPDTFQVTDPTDPVRPRMAIVAGTRPVTTGQARLWVITSISPVPS